MSLQADVAGRVGAGRLVSEVLLAGALGDDDHGVPALLDGPAQVGEEAVLAVELERDLGDEHVVRVVLGERGVAGDEPRVAAHQLHEPDAAGSRARLDVRRADRLRRPRERGPEAEAVVDERDVVVDRLRDADDRDPQPALGDHVGDRLRAVQRPVAADDDEDVDPELLEAVDDLLGVLAPARAAEDRAAVLVDVLDDVRRQLHHRTAVAGDEALVAVAEPDDPVHAVVAGELHHEAADDVVQAGAEPTAGDDPDPGLRRVEEDLPARAARLEARELRRPRTPRARAIAAVSSMRTRSLASTQWCELRRS